MTSVATKSTVNVATKAAKQRVLQKTVKAKNIGATLQERDVLPEATKSLEKAEISTTRGRIIAGVVGSILSETVHSFLFHC